MNDAQFALHDWSVMLDCGIPVLVALDAACVSSTNASTKSALTALRKAIAEGGTLTATMRAEPTVFPARLAEAFEDEGGGQELAGIISAAVLAEAGCSEKEFVQAKSRVRGRVAYQEQLLSALPGLTTPRDRLATLSVIPDAVVRTIIEASAGGNSADGDTAVRFLRILFGSP